MAGLGKDSLMMMGGFEVVKGALIKVHAVRPSGSPPGGRGRNDFPSWPPGTTVLVLCTSPGRFKPLLCLFRKD